MKKFNTALLIVFCLIASFSTHAGAVVDSTQNAAPQTSAVTSTAQKGDDHIEMADRLRAEGKIYVVIAIILIVLFGFLTYLLVLSRKIKKLEQMLNERGR